MADDTTVFGIPSGAAAGAGAGLGFGADIYSFIRQEQQRAALQKIYDILSNPNKLAGYINKFNAPMSAAAIAAVNRDLGANWATQTGGAPGGAMNQYTADAFAKLETQNQATAASEALRALTGATGAIPNAPQGGNLGNILRSLAILKQIRDSQNQKTPGITEPTVGGGPNADPLEPEAVQGTQGVFAAPTTVGAAP